MHRRAFVGSLIGGLASAPRLSPAQKPATPIFGVLLAFSSDAGRTFTKPLRAYLEALGYVEGRNGIPEGLNRISRQKDNARRIAVCAVQHGEEVTLLMLGRHA